MLISHSTYFTLKKTSNAEGFALQLHKYTRQKKTVYMPLSNSLQ